MTSYNFDVTNEVGLGNVLVPKGTYPVEILNAIHNVQEDGIHAFLTVTFKIFAGEYKNHCFFLNIYDKDHSTKRLEFCRQIRVSLLKAINLNVIRDSDQLIGRKLKLDVSIKKGNLKQDAYTDENGNLVPAEYYDNTNSINKYIPMAAPETSKPVSSPPPAQPTPPAKETPPAPKADDMIPDNEQEYPWDN